LPARGASVPSRPPASCPVDLSEVQPQPELHHPWPADRISDLAEVRP
jgi:hypothetical protein